ncbi:MAG: type II toxin-antitoxin system RelE/ParE family toxin [Dehalococcoidia bacterium]|nr:type II toxin-antitoxin system RelE/ParE family toxin [Dehalococcoidia bacterium]MSQ16959.1 type II toxin-antitoxin system RelE/ParE family toxin [Dehalococcoidia bacterium]
MPAYRVTASAVADLDETWGYLDQDSGEAIADRQLTRLYRRFQLLAEQRFLGRPRPEFAPELRSYVVPGTSYIIFYFPSRVLKKGSTARNRPNFRI